MDTTDLHILFTVASFLCFVKIVAWAYSDKPKAAFAEAAELPFNDPEELALKRKAMLLGR